MTPLPPFVPGTQDTRMFSVEGHSFHTFRTDGSLDITFYGEGRDGDYVPSDDERPGVLARAIAGIAGLEPAYIGFHAMTPEVLDEVERRMLSLSGGYQSIGRQIWGDLAAARGALAASRAPLVKRDVYISGGAFSISLDLPLGADAIVTLNAFGLPVGAFIEQALTELGAPIARVPGPGYDPNGHYAIPAGVTGAFLDRALVANEASDVRVSDRP